MDEEDLLDYEVDEVVVIKAILGKKSFKHFVDEYPVSHFTLHSHTFTPNTLSHSHTCSHSFFNLKCFCLFTGTQAGRSKSCAFVDCNCLVVVRILNFVLMDVFNLISDYKEGQVPRTLQLPGVKVSPSIAGGLPGVICNSESLSSLFSFLFMYQSFFVNYVLCQLYYAYSAAIKTIAHGLTGHVCDSAHIF